MVLIKASKKYWIMNKEIELLYKTIEAKDKIINEQALEIARLKGIIEYAIELTRNLFKTEDSSYYQTIFKGQLKILEDKE